MLTDDTYAASPELLDQELEDEQDPLKQAGANPQLLNFERLNRKLNKYYKNVTSIPEKLWRALLVLRVALSSREEFIAFISRCWLTITRLPIVTFYGYLWRTNKFQFLMNLFVNYALPALLEVLPWYFSRRKIGRELRDYRNRIHNQMISGKPFRTDMGKAYVGMTLLYSALETVERHMKTRVQLENRFLIKRLVLERLLFSEVWAVEGFQGGRELERRIVVDISTTLFFFTQTVPAIMSNLFAIFTETKDLYDRRNQLDWLAIVRPFASQLIWKIVDWLHEEVLGRNINATLRLVDPQMQNLFGNVLDGLFDVQLNNLQEQQLAQYDKIMNKEFNMLESVRFFSNRMYTTFTSRGVFDFLSDVFVADVVMHRRNMDYEKYRKLQVDVNHLYNLVKRTGTYLRAAQRVFDRQQRVVELMSLPNFQQESKRKDIIQVSSFDSLVVRDIKFSYHEKGVAPYALNFIGEIKILPKRIYGIIGQNRSGKSTLANLICKLYQAQGGSMFFNGIGYEKLDRRSLRNIISYVAQKPFIFPGTIRENIMVGSPDATEQEILEAAQAAGIFSFDDAVLEAAQQVVPPEPDSPLAPLQILAPVQSQQQGITQAQLASLANRRAADALTVPPRPTPAATLSQQVRSTHNMIAVKIQPRDASQSSAEEVESRPIQVKFLLRKRLGGASAAAVPAMAVTTTVTASEASGAASTSTQPASSVSSDTPPVSTLKKRRMVLDMIVTARGANVSGGFAQSIALARIFLRRNSKIVILDESMSAMDPIKKNSVIFPNLLKFVKQQGITLIMISHDMASLEYVDHIVLLEMGKLVCQGSHEELVARREQKYLQMLGRIFD